MCSFFYVKKAFDSVPHVTLLKHLQSLNLNWVHSYLLERKQFVGIDGSNSCSFRCAPRLGFGSTIVHYVSHRCYFSSQ